MQPTAPAHLVLTILLRTSYGDHGGRADTARMVHGRFGTRLSFVALGSMLLLATACGSSGGSSSTKIASLGTTATVGTDTATSSPQSTQDAMLAYAQCMRNNGIDMADPTFDANGEPTGQLFGPESGVDPQAEGFQAAQSACGDLLQGVVNGRGQGGGLDRDAIQASLNDFTACLRDQGLDVDDITFGGGQGPAGGTGEGGFGGGPPAGGSVPAGATPADGSTPAAPGPGFGGPPPTGDGQGRGFNPTDRIIQQLGLDDTDPAVTAAISACQSILDGAFTPNGSTTTTSA